MHTFRNASEVSGLATALYDDTSFCENVSMGTSNQFQTTLPPMTPATEEQQAQGIMSETTLRLIETVVNAGILPVLVVFGVVGNVISIAVFVRQGLGDRVNLCLFSLAISDTGFSVVHFAARFFAVLNMFDKKLGWFWQVPLFPGLVNEGMYVTGSMECGPVPQSQTTRTSIASSVHHLLLHSAVYWKNTARAHVLVGVYHGFLLISGLLTLVISLQRCVVVVSPLSAKSLPGARQMAVIIISVYAFCFLGNLPYSFRWRTGTCTDHVTNVTLDCIQFSDFVQENLDLWNALVETPFNTCLPIISLVGVTLSNVIIAVRMRSVLAWRKDVGASQPTSSSASSNQREAAMTKMLLVLCVIFSVCTFPIACQAVGRQLVSEFVAGGRYNNIFFASLCVSLFLATFNSSVNVVIYYMMSTKFRETLTHMFECGGTWKSREKESKTVFSTNASSGSMMTIISTS